MTLSVVIPVYNRQRAVNTALRTLVEEASLIDEVVVVDDCSPDTITLDVPPELAGRVKLIRLICNHGSAGARQAGVDASCGDLIAFLDSDDGWLPGKLAAQLPMLRAGNDMLAVACGWQDVPLEAGRAPGARTPRASSNPAQFASGCWFCPGSTVIVSREALCKVGPFDRRLRRLEDLDWFLRFALQGGRLEVAPICGALIAWQPRSNFAPVDAAAMVIDQKFSAMSGLDPDVLRRLKAWLLVERARAFWTSHAWWRGFPAMMMLASSHLRQPRWRAFQMDDWWHQSGPVMSPDAVQERLGVQAVAERAKTSPENLIWKLDPEV